MDAHSVKRAGLNLDACTQQLHVLTPQGVLAGWDEGLEVNVLGLVTGIDVRRPALKLPGIGRFPGEG